MRVEAFLKRSTARSPDKIALVAGGRRLSYSEIDQMSDRLAAGLIENGIARGDRVIVFLDNIWEAVVSIFAVVKAGAVFSPVNPTTKADKLAYILNNCRATGIIALGRLADVAEEACAQASSIVAKVSVGDKAWRGALSFDALLQTERRPPAIPGVDIDLAMLVYTSGSTGFPKGVMMTHQNVEAAATSITTYLENQGDDIVLNCLPISFDYGLYQVLMSIKIGGTLILEKSFTFPPAILARVREENVTGFPLVPTMAAILLQMKDLKGEDYPSLRYLTNTAAALPPAHIERLRAIFPQARLFSMYGLTECKRCTWLPPAELERRPGSVGIAIPNTEATVVDEAGNPVPPNVVGELTIRGATVMKGYWENEVATAKALKPGPYPWEKVLYTGDLFRTDEEGFLYFVGRKDDIIKTRGEKVSPKEVENVLYQIPGVKEAVIIGVPDPIVGSALKAVLAIDAGVTLTDRDVMRHCATHLEDFMVPKYVEFRNELPKTDTGKISRRLVAEEAGNA